MCMIIFFLFSSNKRYRKRHRYCIHGKLEQIGAEQKLDRWTREREPIGARLLEEVG